MHQMLPSLFLLFHFVVVSSQVITHLKFASQWGPHYCLVHASNCRRNIPSEFTIHGIWPDGNPPPPPNGCNPPGPAYKPSKAYKRIVGRLEVQLLRDWPDLSGRPPYKFWKYQWDKHGTCSYHYYKQFHYFRLAVNFRQSYNLSNILQNENINCCKGNVYPAQLIKNAIFDYTQHEPDLRCQLVQGNRLLLVEIIICLDINNLNNVINCTYPSTSCYYYISRGRQMSVTY